jgi:hypothetical protein
VVALSSGGRGYKRRRKVDEDQICEGFAVV